MWRSLASLAGKARVGERTNSANTLPSFTAMLDR